MVNGIIVGDIDAKIESKNIEVLETAEQTEVNANE